MARESEELIFVLFNLGLNLSSHMWLVTPLLGGQVYRGPLPDTCFSLRPSLSRRLTCRTSTSMPQCKGCDKNLRFLSIVLCMNKNSFLCPVQAGDTEFL